MEIMLQGSASPTKDGDAVQVTELHRAAVDEVLVVYVPGEIVSLTEAEEHGLVVTAKSSERVAAGSKRKTKEVV